MAEPVTGRTAGIGYRFEPLPRGGLMLGLSAGQLGLVGASVLLAFVLVATLRGAPGFIAAATSVCLGLASCRSIAGRGPLQWAGIASSFVTRRKVRVAAPPGAPCGLATRVSWLSLPAKTFVDGTHLAELPAAFDQAPIGVLLDERSGTAAAVLRTRSGAFCLLDAEEKERRLASWAAVLESLANQSSSLVRLQWCQRSLRGNGSELRDHLRSSGCSSSPALQGHEALLESAEARSWCHEALVVVSVRAQVRRRRLQEHAEEALLNEVASLRSQLHSAGIACDGPLDAASTAVAVCAPLFPHLDRRSSAYPWPLATEEHWAEIRADGYWHRTYWVAEWPRSRVGPDFLSPLLVGRGRRCFSLVMAPVPPERAARDAESSRTSQLADAQLRAQGGFLETARQRRRAEAVEGREVELADGRGTFRFAGYVAVSDVGIGDLERAAAELERAAAAARLCLRPLYGQQKEALSWVLPFGRGL